LVIPAFLAGCASTPRTSYDWGVNTRFHHRTHVASRNSTTYGNTQTYQDASTSRAVPKPRPEPGWYQDSARRVPPRVADNDAPAPVNADMQFAWPVNGRVISSFGSMDGGARNDGTWEYILGHSGDERTAKLAFDPGQGCGYSTIALAHAALVCENVTGKPYDEFAIEALFKPLGIEHWWFQYYDGGEKIGRTG